MRFGLVFDNVLWSKPLVSLMVSLWSLLMTYYFAACHLQFFIYEHIHQDNWRIGITGLLAQSLGLVPFKNVFWSSRWRIFHCFLLSILIAKLQLCPLSLIFYHCLFPHIRINPGNKFYYNCMEVVQTFAFKSSHRNICFKIHLL